MIITVRSYDPIVIPDDLLACAKIGKFDASTPYIAKIAQRIGHPSYRDKKLPAKIYCLESLYYTAYNMDHWSSYSEPLAGIGLSARIFGRSCSKLDLSDYDSSCVKVLEINFPKAEVKLRDIKDIVCLTASDMIFLDINDFTYKKVQNRYARIVAQAFEAAQKFVLFNDCSIFYLRYGERSYQVYSKLLGQQIATLDDYFARLRAVYLEQFGWYLVKVAYFEESSFQLFSRTDVPLEVKKITGDMRGIVEVRQ